MIFAIIENGIVKNKIVADQSFIDANYPGAIDITNIEIDPNFGWKWDGTNFINPSSVIETTTESEGN